MSFIASWALEPSFYRAPYPQELDDAGTPPMECQFAGVEYALSKNHCLIGDEPGVGKTWQGVMISNAIGAKRTLVIPPASLILNWEREIWKVSTTENVATYPVMKGKDGISFNADYVILSYNMLRNKDILEALLSTRWDHVICDEAHKLKDPAWNTLNTPVCHPDMLPKVTGRFTFISGSPMPNQPIEIYQAARLLDWEAIDFMSEYKFRNYYYGLGKGFVRETVWDDDEGRFVSKTRYSDEVRNQPRRMKELNRRLRDHFMVRRLKEDVLPQLPERQWAPIPLSQDTNIRKVLKSEAVKKAEKLFDLDPSGFDEFAVIDGAVATARRLLGEAKVPQIVGLVNELLEDGVEKVVVGFFNRDVGEAIFQKLKKYNPTFMYGGTPLRKRQKAVDDFQDDPNVRVIVGQFLVMGEGYTLTAADTVINAEPDWTPGKNGQLFDRVHRKGQQSDTTICYMPYVVNSMDERILARVIEKDKNIHAALDKRS